VAQAGDRERGGGPLNQRPCFRGDGADKRQALTGVIKPGKAVEQVADLFADHGPADKEDTKLVWIRFTNGIELRQVYSVRDSTHFLRGSAHIEERTLGEGGGHGNDVRRRVLGLLFRDDTRINPLKAQPMPLVLLVQNPVLVADMRAGAVTDVDAATGLYPAACL
jgi:hypothetical protein